jgi:beta-N-acetylhexosaminidase
MTLKPTHPGRVLMVGLPGPHLDPSTRACLNRLDPAGVILFSRNLDDAPQTTHLLRQVSDLVARPLLTAIDQEGGQVSRLKSWVGPTPAATSLARAGVETTSRFGRATGEALHALGFNVDFAPVVDLCTERATNGIGDRSFGTDPERTALLAGAFLEGLQSAGVAGCLKHFPGLGSTVVDSHRQLPTDTRGLLELERRDLLPFRRLAADAACVMISHGAYPAVDAEAQRPATLSPVIVTDLLRNSLDYRGLIVTDDLEMGAVAPLDTDGAAAVRAIEAGCDLLLYCADLGCAERAVAALERAASESPEFLRRLEQAASNVEATAKRWATRPSAGTDARAALGELESFREYV